MHKLLSLLCFTLLSACTAGFPTLSPFCELEAEPAVASVGRAEYWIVGGEPSTEPESIVKVYIGGSYCTGTVIGSQTVLFAAHCIEEGPAVKVCQGFGNACVGVEWSVSFPGYERSSHFFGDVAVLHTTKPLAYDPLPLATEGLECYNVMKSKGYGQTNNELGGLNEVPVVEIIRDDFIIEVTRGGCYGDSGGPLLVYDRDGGTHILGITSHLHGSGGSCSEVSTVGYVLVFEFADWVREQLERSENEGTNGVRQAGGAG